ncbi:MAG: nicotinamide mononucleotide transporter [Bacteroidetes bacterium]|nr:nicotinamide mononucleotide transporter [Bacteroidota bacterium]
MEILKTLNYFELFSVIISLATSFLTIKQKYIRWPLDILILLINLLIHHKAHMYDRWILTTIILILNFYGWYNWKYGGINKDDLKVTFSSNRLILFLLVFGLITSLSIYWPLKKAHSFLPLISSFRTMFSLIAIWLASRKKIENWILWSILNFISIFIYYKKGLYLFSMKYFVYIILSYIGYRSWFKSMKEN